MVNTEVAKSIKSHGGSKHLLFAKNTLKGRIKLTLHLELFQQVRLVNFYIYMTCRLQKTRKPLQGTFAYIWVYWSGGGVKH